MSRSNKQTPPLAEFLEQAAAFLDAQGHRRRATSGGAADGITIFEASDEERDRAALAESRRWQATKFDSGFGWVTGPPELGGSGLPSDYQESWTALEGSYDVPPAGNLHMGLTTVGPTIAAFGTPDQKRRYLPSIYRGDLVACQLFSEPGAGSDLAGLSTRAERSRSGWAISGQKVWTSAAQYADIGEIICRTDPDQPKHKGLTAFVLDLQAPGVTVRPLRQMTGGSSFNEVFLDQVPVADRDRLGDEGQGWAIVTFSLDAERSTIRNGPVADPSHLQKVLDLAGRVHRTADPVDRQLLARLVVADRVTRWLGERLQSAPDAFGGAELALTKLALGGNHALRSEVVSRLLGPRLLAGAGPEWAWADFVLSAPALRIAGGTDEVLRNMIGERVLGLPREPRP